MAEDGLPAIRPPETWRDIDALWGRASLADRDALVARWSLRVLERQLGSGWVADCWKTGCLPPELAGAPGSPHAFAMLVDLAAALTTLSHHPGIGKVRRILRSNPTPRALASARCGLRLAAAASFAGIEGCELEAGKPPIDVVLQGRARDRLALEIKSVFRADLTLDVDAWLHDLHPRIFEILHDGRVSLQGEAREPLDAGATERLASQLISAAGLVRLGLEAPVIVAGANRFQMVAVTDDQRPGSHIAMPSIDLWRKIASRIRSALEQAASSGATWVVIDSQDDLWTLTPWSRGGLGSQATGLAEAIMPLLAPESKVDGVMVTDGGRLVDLTSMAETAHPDARAIGLRRRLDRVRVRQAVVVALSTRGQSQMDSWRRVFNAEPGWVDEALARQGLEYPPSLRPLETSTTPV